MAVPTVDQLRKTREAANSVNTEAVSSNIDVTNSTAVWAENAAANTAKTTAAITIPTPPAASGRYALEVKNPSTVTAITVKSQVIRGTDVFDKEIQSIPANSNVSLEFTGLGGGGMQFVFSNDTALGAGEGFTLSWWLRKV